MPILLRGPTVQTAIAKTNAVKTFGEDLQKVYEGEWTGKVEIRTGKTFLAVGDASVAMF